MKLVLGIYTGISSSSPVPIFDRALSLMYEPLLYFLFNNSGYKLSLYQSSAMMKHINKHRPEFKALISAAAKRSDIEMISGSYSQTVLSLIPPKERANQIEKMTSLIRRDYGVLPSISFMFGQIWSPLYISTLKNSGMDGVVISTYKATDKAHIASDSFVMNELGKRITIYAMNDNASALVSSYAQNEITLSDLEDGLVSLIDGYSGESLVVFLNIDQLLEGSSRDGEENDIGRVVVHLLERYKDNLVHLDALKIATPGYLDSGWYGRDAWANGLKSFNDIFVRNENFRYLLNRYIALTEFSSRGNKLIKKDIYRYLFDISTGSLFIHDAECTPMRLSERRSFWASIIDAESTLLDESGNLMHKEYDLEEMGENDYFTSNKLYTAVLSPRGASVAEFDYKSAKVNIMDTRVQFDKRFLKVPLLKSFSDIIEIDGSQYSTQEKMFRAEVLDRKRTDFQFTLSDSSFPLSISKHYKMRTTTFICDVLLKNNTDKDIKGTYNSIVYLDSRDIELFGQEMRKELFAKKVVNAKTVRYNYRNSALQVVFSSIGEFSLSEENVSQSQYTSLGLEEFFLYKRLCFSFAMDIKAGSEAQYRLVLRVNESKENSNVHRE